MEKLLRLYKFVDGVNDSPFPNATQQAILYEFRYDAKRMGNAPTISGTLMHPLCLDNLWGNDLVYIVYNSERYFLKQTPTSSYSNEDTRYKHEVDFVSERIVLNDVYFYDVVQGDANIDKPVSNSSSFTFYGDIHEFAQRLNYSLQYAKVGYSVVVDEGISSEAKMISFQNQFIANALQESYNTYEIPYYFVGKVIHIGFTDNAITRTFKYGIDDALLSITKSNANYKVVNRATGTGSSDNIPYYYPNKYESKEQVEAEGGTWIPPQTNLMPPIYRESLGDERFYNALNGAYINPQTNDYYEFANPYQDGKPKEQIVSFDDIKPSIVGITNASGARIDMFSDFAYDRNDNDETDEEGNYLHPYFFAKLRKFNGAYGFNLFEHAIEEDEMVISMTSGNCGACNFVIGVDSETQKNTVQVDENGNLLRDDDGNILFGSPQDRQNDTQNYEVWIALRKDIETFGVIMPNATNNYKPNAGDTFVILHIDLPQSYIEAAENRLKEEIIKYMAMNNSEKFTFSITFSRIFFAENLDVLAQLNENARLQIEYNNKTYELYVSSYSYNMTSDKALPEIRVELSDTLTITQNALQTAISEVKTDIMNSVGSIDWLRLGLKYFLRKDTNDRSRGKVASDVGFEVGKFVSGASGAIVYVDKTTGQTVAELDKLYVRMKAYFETLEIINANSVGGKQIISPAGSIKCIDVKDRMVDASGNEIVWDYYRCYFLSEQDGEKVENRFVVGDQAYSQLFNAQSGVSNNISNKYYWRLVVGVGENYIDLSKSDCDSGSDVPEVGDVICHRGNRNDVDRQNVIEVSSVDTFSPSITLYQGINSYSLSGKDIVSFGVDKTTNKAFMNVYGDMYVGDRNNTSYMRYTQENGLELKGRLAVGTTLSDGRELEQAIKDATPEGYNEFVEKVLGDLGSLQQQVDGAIDSYFYEYAPTLDNYPANEWDTDAEKEAHLNDTFTNLLDGRSWRWTTAGWVEITDTATTKALAIAGQAKDIADGKRRVFIDTPYPPYDLGDLWAGGSNMPLMRCVVAKGENGVFEESDWDYADNTTKQLAGYEYLKRALGESTTVEGGLIQTSLLMLGYTSNGTFNVMSGTNGLYDSTKLGGGIAAWYGGPMADKEADSSLVSYAQSLFRFDGSGYLAGGNITWDKYGAGSVAGGDISWDKDGVITLAQTVKISGDANETLSSVLNALNEFRKMFQWDDDGNIQAKAGLWTDSFLTAGGQNSGSGGDVTGVFYLKDLYDVTLGTLVIGDSLVWNGSAWVNQPGGTGFSESAMWTALGGSEANKVIAASHLPADYNAGSATKLATSRTIWGQSFDGTGNVDGRITINFSGGAPISITQSYSSAWVSCFNAFNSLLSSGQHYNLNLGYSDNARNNAWIGFYYYGAGSVANRLSMGLHSVDDVLNITGNSNVLIGTTTDGGHKLRVQGSTYITGEGIFGSIISANSGILSRSELSFRNNAVIQSYSLPLQLNPQGNNILVGTTTDGPITNASGHAMTARLQIHATGADDNNVDIPLLLVYDGPLAGPRMVNALSPNLPLSTSASHGLHFYLGVKESQYNGGYLKFWYAGDGLTNNALRMGFFGADNLMSLLANGNVLIGTTTDAGYKFTVDGAALANTVRTQELRLGEAEPSGSITQNKWYYASITYEYTDAAPATRKPDMVFKTMYNTYAEGSGVERMRIKSNGNILMGTTTDNGYKLDIAGTLNATTIYQNGQTLDKHYLPLSGGTISGDLAIEGYLYGNGIRFRNNPDSETILSPMSWVNYDLGWYNGSVWKTFTFLDSNVASATKLQTARTIWGQSFDGTGNVDGRITINFSGGAPISITQQYSSTWVSCFDAFNSLLSSGQYYNINWGYSEGARNKAWIGFYYYGTGSVANRLTMGLHSVDNVLSITGNSNVLIGTTTDAGYKLYVNGTLSAGATTVASLTSNGNISATSSTILGYTGRFFDVMPRTDGSSGVYNLGSSDNRWTAYLKSADITGNIRLKPASANYGNYLYFGNGSYCYIAELTDDKMTIYASSGLQITANTNVSGNIYATGEITAGTASDRRLKDNIQSMTDEQAVSVLRSLRPVTFNWNSIAYELGKHSGYSDGFIADEYERLIPNSGRSIWSQYRAINYERAISYVVKGWQTHETRLEKLERENRELRGEVERLKQYRRA